MSGGTPGRAVPGQSAPNRGRVIPSNRKSFKRRGFGLGSTRLLTRDQEHHEGYPRWAWAIAVISGIVAGIFFFRWALSL